MSTEVAIRQLETVGPGYERQRFIGGSDIAGILNRSPWSSPVRVYYRKTEPEQPTDAPSKRKLFQRGKKWEAVVGEMLVAELEDRGHTVEITGANRRYVDPDVDYFASEIDYELTLDGVPNVNAELKTVHPNAMKYWGESDTEDCPLYYYAQGMWGLGVTRRQCCILAPLFGADSIRVYPIVRDDETIQLMRATATRFWVDHVLPRIPPEPLSLNDVSLLYPKHDTNKVIVADENLLTSAYRFRTLVAQVAALDAERQEAEFHVKRVMRDAEIIEHQGKKIFTWKHQATKAIDIEALKANFPKVAKECTETRDSRVFRTYAIAKSEFDGD